MGTTPPFVGFAVNVTLVPTQIGIATDAVTLTEGVTSGFTVIVVAAEFAVKGDAQGEFEVITTLTLSLLTRLVVVNVPVVVGVPTFTPFTRH